MQHVLAQELYGHGRRRSDPGSSCIDATEERGISLSQLRRIWETVQAEHSGWTDARTGQKLSVAATDVDFYQLLHCWLQPTTKQAACSYVELLSDTAQIPAWCVAAW